MLAGYKHSLNKVHCSTMSKGKNMSNVLANGVIFFTLKLTDPHTVRGGSTLKIGKVSERAFRNGSFRELKIAKESSDLAKVLPEPNQKSHELSTIRKCGRIVTQARVNALTASCFL